MIAALSLVLAQTALGLVVAVLVFSYPFSASRWAGLILALILASVAFNGLYMALAVSISNFRTFTGISSLSMLVLVFVAPAFSTTKELPTVLQWVSWVNPVTYALDSMRAVSIFGFSQAWPSMLVLAGVALVANAVAVRGLLRRSRNL
jgi:ABC-2 type transport system permease protein